MLDLVLPLKCGACANDTAVITDRSRPLSGGSDTTDSSEAVVHSQYDDRFIGLAEAPDDELSHGDELGAAVAVGIGVAAVDIWGCPPAQFVGASTSSRASGRAPHRWR